MFEWTSDELILAADLAVRNGWDGVRAHRPEAIALSGLLRRARIYPAGGRPENFRSPSSVQRKTYDLVTQRDGYPGVPTRGSSMDKPVVDAFERDPEGMAARAEAIRSALTAGEEVLHEDPDLDGIPEASAWEGRLLPSMHLRRERSPRLRADKISHVLASGGKVACEVCSFDFAATYGERGEGYIEVHHITPLHVIGEGQTKLADLALVCSNCHRMIHRGALLTPDRLRLSLSSRVSATSG